LRRLSRYAPSRFEGFLGVAERLVGPRGRSTIVDLDEYSRKVANVQSWCQQHPKETVIDGLTQK
jgi:hypothetical protein